MDTRVALKDKKNLDFIILQMEFVYILFKKSLQEGRLVLYMMPLM